MTSFSGPPAGAIRNKPISAELKAVIESAAQAAGIDAIHITSGGQDALGSGTRRTGSTRHDHGKAADLWCMIGGAPLTFSNSSADPRIVAFVTAAAAAGATGIGAGTDYMGDRTIHVGFGRTEADLTRLTWGRDGQPAHAPTWLRVAAEAGWTNPTAVAPPPSAAGMVPGRFMVMARSGLRLRGGPGTAFDVERLLPQGTILTLVALDGTDSNWGRVDLEGDGLADGYVHCGFLEPAAGTAPLEDVPEPNE